MANSRTRSYEIRFLDTCVIVDCAFARKEKSSPKLLERLMGRLGDSGVKLILPRSFNSGGKGSAPDYVCRR